MSPRGDTADERRIAQAAVFLERIRILLEEMSPEARAAFLHGMEQGQRIILESEEKT